MKTTPSLFCFVLMPFEESFDDVYKLGIKEACNIAGAYCERVDEQIFQESILERVYNQISKADLIIADMTTRNPNVFYEVGYAHAIGKPTILLTNNSSDIPFDLKHFQHIVYNNKISYLKDELSKRIQWYIDNPLKSDIINKFHFDVFMDKNNLLKQKTIFVCAPNYYPHPIFTLYNPTAYSFEPGSFRIGIISLNNYKRCSEREIESIELPDDKVVHMLPYLDIFFPNSYLSFNLTLRSKPPINQQDEFIIRIFSQFGTMDYPFYLESNDELERSIVKIV